MWKTRRKRKKKQKHHEMVSGIRNKVGNRYKTSQFILQN